MIAVESYVGGIRAAAGELLLEALYAEVREKLTARMAGAANVDRAGDGLEVKRTQPAGCYDWVRHLAELERLAPHGARVTAAEAAGLDALALERGEFQRAHPPCGHCGRLLLRAGDYQCWGCGENLKERR